jgi:GMP synthase-like glutamine amidotransferase
MLIIDKITSNMEARPFSVGIVDFNPKRMTDQQAVEHGIPAELRDQVADFRQYPLNISRQLPDGVSWYSAQQPWFFRSVMADAEKRRHLVESDILILSGSGMSAYQYQENAAAKFSPEDTEALSQTEDLIRNHLGEGKWALGICFGGQLAMHAVDGGIGRLPTNSQGNTITEAGWLDHQLTEAGKVDDVARGLPEHFFAPHLHSDYVAQLPAVGTVVSTASGDIKVTKAEVLAVRYGYADRDGLQEEGTAYTQMSVVEFDNGAKLYQIQPHPEMATPEKANFLVAMNPWIADENEMGKDYYEKALAVPADADFAVAQVVTRFTEAAKEHLEQTRSVHFINSVLANPLVYQYLLEK